MNGILGRGGVVGQIRKRHESSARPHLSIVGPRGIGKSFVVRAVVEANRHGTSAFAGAGLVDLRHHRPCSVAEMVSLVGLAVRAALADASRGERRWMCEFITPTSPPDEVMDQMVAALATLEGEGERLLLALDGCDPVLQNPLVPVHLWESLRQLAQSSALRLLTASRKSLVELCRNPEAQVSPFFNLFGDTQIRLAPFDDGDWTELGETLAGRVDGSGLKELRNWTGGRPDLLRPLLDIVLAAPPGLLGKPEVDASAGAMLRDGSNALEAVWLDCPDAVRGDVVHLITGDSAIADGPRREYLIVNGLAVPAGGGKLHLANGLVRAVAADKGSDVTDVRRLFDSDSVFNANIRSVLELRVHALNRGDPELRRLAGRCVRDLPDDPAGCLGNARDIAEIAFLSIWAVEAPDGKVPERWLEVWKDAGLAVDFRWLTANRRLPPSDKRGDHCQILRLATGTDRAERVTTHLTKGTFVLLEHIVNLGNLRNHRGASGAAPPTITAAVAFCFGVIEFIGALHLDLAPRQPDAT